MLTTSMLTDSMFNGSILPTFIYDGEERTGVKVVKMGRSKQGNDFFKGENENGFRTFSYDKANVQDDTNVLQVITNLFS